MTQICPNVEGSLCRFTHVQCCMVELPALYTSAKETASFIKMCSNEILLRMFLSDSVLKRIINVRENLNQIFYNLNKTRYLLQMPGLQPSVCQADRAFGLCSLVMSTCRCGCGANSLWFKTTQETISSYGTACSVSGSSSGLSRRCWC